MKLILNLLLLSSVSLSLSMDQVSFGMVAVIPAQKGVLSHRITTSAQGMRRLEGYHCRCAGVGGRRCNTNLPLDRSAVIAHMASHGMLAYDSWGRLISA